MTQQSQKTEYSREELLRIVKGLQAKLNFYKEKYAETQNEEIMFQEIYEKLNDEEEKNQLLIEQVNVLERENKQLQDQINEICEKNEHLTSLIEKNNDTKNTFSDIRAADLNKNQNETKNLNHPNRNLKSFDPWFESNLKEKNRINGSK
jgi:seryl-tRNA synthetase